MSQAKRRQPSKGLSGSTDEEILAAETTRLKRDRYCLRITLDPGATVCIVSLIQLACRHPAIRNSTSARQGEGLARMFQDRLASVSPELGRLLERGWHELSDADSSDGDIDAIEFDDLDPDLRFAPTENPNQKDVNP